MNAVRRASRAVLTRAVRGGAAEGSEWGEALLAEFDEVEGTWAAARWAVGGVRLARRIPAPKPLTFRTKLLRRIAVASAAGLAVLAFGHWVIRPSYVPSGSMAPTIAIGDRVLVDRVGFQLTGVERGDIVVFDHDEDGRHDEFVKRVIALGGDRVECRSGRLYRNGGELDEPYLSRQGVTQCDSLTVPDGGVFVLGDDRDVSRDSRAFGAVPARDVVGRVLGTVPFTIPATPVL